MRKFLVAVAIAALSVSVAQAGSNHRKKVRYHSSASQTISGATIGSNRGRTMERVGSGASASFGRDSGGTRSPGVPGDIGNR